MLSLIPFAWKLAGAGILAAAVIAGVSWWSIHEYRLGYNKCVADVAAADQAAIDRVKQGQGDLAKCRASGGIWSVVEGKCL